MSVGSASVELDILDSLELVVMEDMAIPEDFGALIAPVVQVAEAILSPSSLVSSFAESVLNVLSKISI